MARHRYTTQAQIRAAFWESHPDASRKLISYGGERIHTTDTRCLFCDWLDAINKAGEVSDELAQRATLRPGKRQPAKYKRIKVIQMHSTGHGWEDLDEYDDTAEGRKEARRMLGEYKLAHHGAPHRIITRRVLKEADQ